MALMCFSSRGKLYRSMSMQHYVLTERGSVGISGRSSSKKCTVDSEILGLVVTERTIFEGSVRTWEKKKKS